MSQSDELPIPPAHGGPCVEEWERDVQARAETNSGVVDTRLGAFYEDEQRLVRLADAAPANAAHDTETLLNGLIEDCRFLIREVAFHSARLTPDAQHRLEFLSSAKTLAVTGAEVARTIALLRQDRPPEPAENRYRMIVEHVQAPVRKGG